MPLLVAAGALVVRRWRLAAALVLVVLLKLALERAVKLLVQRERPGTTVPDAVLRGVHSAGLSFVSGHAIITTFAIAGLLGLVLSRRWAVVAFVLATCNASPGCIWGRTTRWMWSVGPRSAWPSRPCWIWSLMSPAIVGSAGAGRPPRQGRSGPPEGGQGSSARGMPPSLVNAVDITGRPKRVISQAPELYEQKIASPQIAPVITADIRTASGDLGPDWSQKSSKSSRCPRWPLPARLARIPLLLGQDPRAARAGWPAWPQPGGACGPPCRGRGPVRRWPEPAPGRPHHPAPPAGSRRRGLAAPGWRRPRLGRSRPATPCPACPPSRWLAPGRGGQSGPSAGLRPAPRRRSIAAIESATRCRRRGRSYVFPCQAAKPVDRHWIAISKLLVAPSMTAQPLLPSPALHSVCGTHRHHSCHNG
jgi:hypothetical protein